MLLLLNHMCSTSEKLYKAPYAVSIYSKCLHLKGPPTQKDMEIRHGTRSVKCAQDQEPKAPSPGPGGPRAGDILPLDLVPDVQY